MLSLFGLDVGWFYLDQDHQPKTQIKMTTLEDIKQIIEAAIAPLILDIRQIKGDVAEVKGDVAQLKGDVTQLKGDVAQLKGDVAQIKSRQEFAASASVIRMSNAIKGPSDHLKAITHNYTGDLLDPALEQPSTWAVLAVGGSECVPLTGAKNTWTREKSKALLAAYFNEGGDSDTDGEGEYGLKARARRVAVAEVMGISASRITALASL